MTVDKQDYPKASNAVVFGGVITYIAGLLLLMSFTSPYWIESYHDTFSTFKHMGLWEYCFDQFRYPYYQFDKLFDGCHHVFSQEYFVIREWLLPVWLMVVQAFVTLSLILSFASQAIIVLILIRWPLRFVLHYEWILSAAAFIFNATTGALLFLAVAIFGGQCWRRDWLMYPNFNHLSWSYGLAAISFMLHSLAAFLLYLNARAGYTYRKESRNLVMQMQPNPQSHHAPPRTGYI
ncbi:PREDICTED: uncharacterized protein LOC106793814 [Polistes canadensis]|uniref:uncharacterized protein LOC106793814 n=1 Tax=Polistes canadensis TaxID=91411 RepID=UPI000718DD3C|nr:PREDICTED: uncharacterized protein LOC106793814 [Polistes canadensis]KAI4475684.1 hypothetical protein M0804_014147 [Polistes exclamans]KAI4475690.1 hypothetical protein M0804_014144 [Polistes exclamans]